MHTPPFCAADETQRVRALRSLGVLDTAPEPVFDAITALAARACGVPIALISLVDADRQWFKSNRGLPGVSQTSRSVAFCDHAIRDEQLLEVNDAAEDPRFALNPLVTGDPHIRFYAGMPIVMPGGERVGTVCVIDREPRQLEPLQLGLLEELGRLAATYLFERSQSLETRQALAESETRYRRLYEATPAILHSIDAEGRLLTVSDRWLQVLGYERHEVIGQRSVDFLTPESRRRATEEDMPGLYEAGRIDNIEYQFERKDGRVVDVLLSATLENSGASSSLRSLSILQDVTGQKALAAELGRTHTHLDTILNNVPVMLGYWDRDHVIRFVNREFEDGVGQSGARLIGQSFERMFEAVDPHFLPQALKHLREVMQGQRQEFECAMLLLSGLRQVHVTFVPDRSEHGDVNGFYGMWIDITGRKSMEIRLRSELEARLNSERHLRVVTDHLPALVSYLDHEQRFRFANKAYQDWFGMPPHQLLGKTLLEFYGPAVHQGIEPHFRAAFAGELISYERPMKGAGSRDYVQVTMVPHRNEQGAVVGVYTLIHDISDRRRAELARTHSEQLLDRTGSIAGVGGWQLELATQRIHWTSQTRRIHEVEDDYVPDIAHAINFYAEEGRPVIERALQQAMDAGTPWDLVLPFVTGKGRPIWVRATGEVEFEDGKPVRMLGAFQDVSQRVAFEHRLHEQAELLQVTLKSIGDGVITTDEHGRVRWMNPAAERMTGWTSAAAAGKVSAQVFHVVHADTRAVAPDPVDLCLRTLGMAGLPSRSVLISGDGEEFAVEDSASPIHDEAGRLRGAVLVFHDVSEQRRMSDQMTHRATHDELTGLVNRAEFETRVERVLANSRHDATVSSMMFIDLDQFKLVNDACGHAMGDKLLCQVSTLLSQCVRNRDTLARLGGDEFGVLLEHCNVEQAHRVAQGICDRMDEFRFIHDGRKFRIGTSIGLVPIDARWPTPASLRQAADTACYAAKEAGRNRVHVWFDTDLVLRNREGETRWGSRLESALDEDDFVLFAQRIDPVMTASAGLHFEVLLRLREHSGAIVAPGLFLPAAERFHMASRIDQWVLRKVFEWMAADSGSADIETIAVNLSGQSIGDRAFHRFVVQLLDELPVDPSKLCFEVTETSAITNLADATSFIRSMRKLGMRVALDDFGVGASSFGYLKNLPVDYLKIDGQFIRNMQNNPLDMAAVRCFHEVAKAIGVKTVAEFVETEAIMQTIREIGIDFAQGYLIHRPQPLQAMVARARSEHTLSHAPRVSG